MSHADDHDEERILEALILAALRGRRAVIGPPPDPVAPPPPLDDEDWKALDALGPDLVARVLAGTWRPRRGDRGRRPARQTGAELAGAMQRGPEDGELTERARDEIERKVRELDSEDEPEEGP